MRVLIVRCVCRVSDNLMGVQDCLMVLWVCEGVSW